MKSLRELAESMHCLETVDKNDFQRRARILQAIWRTEQDLPIGQLVGKPRGAMLAMPWAKETLANFMSDEVRQVVRETLDGGKRQKGSLILEKRMYDNLLSSQPMVFNLFVPLQHDLQVATSVFAKMLPGRCARVTKIAYEYSPGRGDRRYTEDNSAFDACVWFDTPGGKPGFVGIEVKYHENLNDKAGKHRPRYDEVAEAMGCFVPGSHTQLRCKPLQQIWRDHLLSGAYRMVDGFADGLFVYLSPAGNPACNDAVAKYQNCLTVQDTFEHWSLESFVDTVKANTSASWIRDFVDRFLAFEKVDALLM
jgi:PD-(D/E)XK nuclease superfamily